MGLGFFRGQAGGYRTVGHDGIWLGFHSAVALVPDEWIGVVALTNTGPFSPFAATGPVADAVLRSLLGLPEDVPATGVPERPWDWDELCGSYSFGPGILTDPQPRMLGPAVQVSPAATTSSCAVSSPRRPSGEGCASTPTPVIRTCSESSCPASVWVRLWSCSAAIQRAK